MGSTCPVPGRAEPWLPARVTVPDVWKKTEAVAIRAQAASQKLLELVFILLFNLLKLSVNLPFPKSLTDSD